MTNDETFTAAYWAFLRGQRVFEPRPEEYGLDKSSGEVLKAQCDIHFDHHKPKGTK